MFRVCVLFVVCLCMAGIVQANPSVALYYGADPPLDELRAFDIVVVDPDSGAEPNQYESKRSRLFSYVSVGELDDFRRYASAFPKDWLIGENKAWKSKVIDQSQADWPSYFVDRIIAPLWQRGFRGFFLDTLDSYQIAAKTAAARKAQEAGLIAAIKLLKARYPEAQLIFNRGFEILPAVHELAYMVAAESLFEGWNEARQTYHEVEKADREWLLQALKGVRDKYRLPVLAIDYVAPAEREKARATARKIRALGFIPWVSNPALDQIGIGAIEVAPRKILMLYDGEPSPDLWEYPIHLLASMPLNYFGYVPVYFDARGALPAHPLQGRYAGIVTWFDSDAVANPNLAHWLAKQTQDGLPVAMLGAFGFALDREKLAPFGLSSTRTRVRPSPVKITSRAPIVGFEIEPIADTRGFIALDAGRGAELLLQIGSADGERMDAIAYTSWGGYALSPYLLLTLPNSEARWVIDPMDFLRRALRLVAVPAADVTTENGRRLMLVHIDGDGFPSRGEFPGSPFASEILRREVLERFRIPTTVSIIQGEISANGLYPTLAAELEGLAREIFALPHVEIASHSYSHPFDWHRLGLGERHETFHLPILGYSFDLNAEVGGSIAYIDRNLAPAGKRTKVFLWSGDTQPNAEALQQVQRAGVLNMNGGVTRITETRKSLTLVAPLGLTKGEQFQVYAPIANENTYTNLWIGPFYGYERVIETFRLTESPRRLKPINIYYHTYSASKQASLAALHKVYAWALNQSVFNIYASEYIAKVLDFNRLSIARDGDTWRIRGADHLRTLRVDSSFPDLAASSGVAGYSDHPSGRYIHLIGDDEVRLRLSAERPTEPYLAEANARIDGWRRSTAGLHFGLAGHLPLRFALGNARDCIIRADGKRIASRKIDRGLLSFELTQNAIESITVTCPG